MSKKSGKPNFSRYRQQGRQEEYKSRPYVFDGNGNRLSQQDTNGMADDKPDIIDIPEQDTPKLRALEKDLYDESKRMIFILGYPSTGKTKKATDAAIMQLLDRDLHYKKFVLVRPILKQSTGYLPGELENKMNIHMAQCSEYMEEKANVSFIALIGTGRAQILPADALQGLRFRNKIVIIDEAQNIPKKNAFSIYSRVGEHCKLIVIGDTTAGQCPDNLIGNNILDYGIDKFGTKSYAKVHKFLNEEDILGDDVTQDIIRTMLPDFAEVN